MCTSSCTKTARNRSLSQAAAWLDQLVTDRRGVETAEVGMVEGVGADLPAAIDQLAEFVGGEETGLDLLVVGGSQIALQTGPVGWLSEEPRAGEERGANPQTVEDGHGMVEHPGKAVVEAEGENRTFAGLPRVAAPSRHGLIEGQPGQTQGE